jgi:hypothetical protein
MPLSPAPSLFQRVRRPRPPLAEVVEVQREVVQREVAAAVEEMQYRKQASDPQRRRRTSRHTAAFRWF